MQLYKNGRFFVSNTIHFSLDNLNKNSFGEYIYSGGGGVAESPPAG